MKKRVNLFSYEQISMRSLATSSLWKPLVPAHTFLRHSHTPSYAFILKMQKNGRTDSQFDVVLHQTEEINIYKTFVIYM